MAHQNNVVVDKPVENTTLGDEIIQHIRNQTHADTVWFRPDNLPRYGNKTPITTKDIPASWARALENDDQPVTAETLVNAIYQTARNATRFRRAHAWTDSNHRNSRCGDSGTQVTALNTSYIRNVSGISKERLRSTYNLRPDTPITAANIIAAINDFDQRLRNNRRTAPIVELKACHCNCHHNCHKNRSRR